MRNKEEREFILYKESWKKKMKKSYINTTLQYTLITVLFLLPNFGDTYSSFIVKK
jgi:hypothetical protein